MKPTPLVLLSLSVLAGAGPVPEDSHPTRDNADQALVAAANAGEGRSVLDSSGKSANSRRKARALGAQNRRARRRQRQFRRDDDWTKNDDADTEGEQPAPVSAPAPAPNPDQSHGDDGYYTDNDGHYTSCDENPEREKCTKRPRVQTTQKPVPATTTKAPVQPKPTNPDGPWTDTDNPDWETDCDADWSDDGERERCKTKTKARAITRTTVNKVPAPTITTARPYTDDTDNPDYLTDCNGDWSDDGEVERCRTKTALTRRITASTSLASVQAPDRTVTTAASLPTNGTDTDNPDYLTDCDADWSDDGERERCRTRVVSVTTTSADAAGTGAPNEPVEVTNGGARQTDGVKHAVAMAGLVAAAALAF